MISEYVEDYTFSTNLDIHFPPKRLGIFHPCNCRDHRHRGQAATACKKSAAHAGLRTCVELRQRRNSISGGRPSRCAWCRRALGNHDVDGGEHSGLLVGSCIQSCVPAWRGRGSPGGSRARSVPTRVASARPCVSNKKSAGRAWQLCQALDGYSLSLPKRSINRSASYIARIKNQAIAKQSGSLHTVVACVRRPSQFVYPSASPLCGS